MAADTLTNQETPALVNGVSRQPAVARLPSQVQDQTNAISDAARGIIRRPPTDHIKDLDAAGSTFGTLPAAVNNGSGLAMHIVDRGEGVQHAVVVGEGTCAAFDLTTGAEINVTSTVGAQGNIAALKSTAYVWNNIPDIPRRFDDMISFASSGNDTFIANRTYGMAQTATTPNPRENTNEFFFYIFYNGQTVQENTFYLSFDGGTTYSDMTNGPNPKLDICMDRLCTSLTGVTDPVDVAGDNAPALGSNNWKFTRVSDTVLYGYQFQGTDVQVKSKSGFGDSTALLVQTPITGDTGCPSVPLFSDLPSVCRDGFTVRIAGDPGEEAEAFYVTYSEEEGVWKESTTSDPLFNFATAGFPLKLTWQPATSDYSLNVLATEFQPTVGDAESNLLPAAVDTVGKRGFINDMLFVEDRLCLVIGESVWLSEIGKYGTFFPTTASTIVDSDAFVVSGSGARYTEWRNAAQAGKSVYLMSPTGSSVARLVGADDKKLTLETARIEEVGRYASDGIPPFVLGNDMYFAGTTGTYSQLYSLREVDYGVYRTDSVSAHLRDYLPPEFSWADASPTSETIAFLKDTEPSKLYLYRTHTVGGEKVMSSWCDLDFGAGVTIVTFGFNLQDLWLLTVRDGSVHIERVAFGRSSDVEDWRIHLDLLVAGTGVYDANTHTTTWSLPYNQDSIGGDWRLIRDDSWGALAGVGVFFGRTYESNVTLSEIVIRERDNTAKLRGRLQVREGTIAYNDTGTFDVVISSVDDSDEYRHTYTPLAVGTSPFGTPVVDSGVHSFDIGGHSESVRVSFKSDSYLPFAVSSFAWIGRYTDR
jgi:hypothetical protein